MQSAFGVDHGLISKKEKEATPGRHISAWIAPGAHGAVAGKKGKKLKAAGTELGSSIAGGVAGTAAGLSVGRLTRSPSLAQGIAAGTGAAGSMLGTAHAQKKGYYKKQRQGAF